MQVRLVFEGVYLGHFCAANSTHLEFIEHIFTAPQERILALERRLAPTATRVCSAATGHPNAPFVARESIVAQDWGAALVVLLEPTYRTTERMRITTMLLKTVLLALPESPVPLARPPVVTVAREPTRRKQRVHVPPARR